MVDELTSHLAALDRRAETIVSFSRFDMRFLVTSYIGASLVPRRFVTSVRAVVQVEGKLVALRNPDGVHVLPGGRLELGESYEDGLRREVFEETGLSLRRMRQIGLLHFRHLTPKPAGYEYPYPDMIHLVFEAFGSGRLRSGDTDGWEEEAFLLAPERARALEGNEHEWPFIDVVCRLLGR
jgi:ADP-ribose pyrophosphatase YjhB (NUDIX family)